MNFYGNYLHTHIETANLFLFMYTDLAMHFNLSTPIPITMDSSEPFQMSAHPDFLNKN